MFGASDVLFPIGLDRFAIDPLRPPRVTLDARLRLGLDKGAGLVKRDGLSVRLATTG